MARAFGIFVLGSLHPHCGTTHRKQNTDGDFIDGFFDAGMLLQALKANAQGDERERAEPPSRRSVGKKLRLSEY